jgi:hypothetical protein
MSRSQDIIREWPEESREAAQVAEDAYADFQAAVEEDKAR